MDNMFFWEYNDEHGFFDEDDIMVNKNDPFSEHYYDDARLFYGEDANDCCEFHTLEEDVLDEYDLDRPPEIIIKDSFNTSDAIAGGAVFGGMVQDEVISDTDIEEIIKEGDKIGRAHV